MKNLLLVLTILTLFSCSKDEDPKSSNDESCRISEIKSDAGNTKFEFDNEGKIISIDYSTSKVTYLYDSDGGLKESLSKNGTIVLYSLNSKGLVALEKVYYDGVLQSSFSHQYNSDNKITSTYGVYMISFEGVDTLFSEIEYDYENGNLTTERTYHFNNIDKTKKVSEIAVHEYDKKKNAYRIDGLEFIPFYSNTNNLTRSTYQKQPGNNSSVEYTYNDKGWPISFERTDFDSQDNKEVTTIGEILYNCN